jgi:hypothetical protein
MRELFPTTTTNETKDGRMHIDPKGEPSDHGQVPSMEPDAAPASRSTARRSRNGRGIVPFALLGVMTIGVGLAAFFAVVESTTPSDAVASALTNSLRFKSAATTLSVRATEAGGRTDITSEGVTSFESPEATQVVRVSSGDEHFVEHVVSDGSTIYLSLNGGVIAKVVPGKSWLSLPSGQSTASSVTGGGSASSDSATLRVLSATGNDVTDLGSSRMNGHNVHRYSVHLTRSQINRDIAQEHLPLFMRQAIALVHIPAITYTLAINGANQLAQMKTTLHLQADGQQIAEHLTEGYSRYGTRVTVAKPPSNEVIPFQTFLQIAEQKDLHVTI